MSPLHDYGHPDCGVFLVDQYRSVEEGARANPPLCEICGLSLDWLPQVGSMDAYEPGTEFDTFDGRNRPVHVDSLKKLREVERESEKMSKDGVGQPMVWRKYSQDPSNVHSNTLGPNQSEAPTREAARRFSPLRHGTTAPDREYGPGVSDANTSALKE